MKSTRFPVRTATQLRQKCAERPHHPSPCGHCSSAAGRAHVFGGGPGSEYLGFVGPVASVPAARLGVVGTVA